MFAGKSMNTTGATITTPKTLGKNLSGQSKVNAQVT